MAPVKQEASYGIVCAPPVRRQPVSKKKPVSRSAKAGISFPVSRIARYLKKGKRYGSRIGAGAPVYTAAVLEYLTAEILELAGNAAKFFRKDSIRPRHIMLAIREDEELAKLLGNVIIPSGGVLFEIHTSLVRKGLPEELRKAPPASRGAVGPEPSSDYD